jgi:hypothetical protein
MACGMMNVVECPAGGVACLHGYVWAGAHSHARILQALVDASFHRIRHVVSELNLRHVGSPVFKTRLITSFTTSSPSLAR